MKRFPELNHKAQRGSKPRCHLFTDGTPAEVVGRLTALVKPYGSVSGTSEWRPVGFDDVDEVQLDKPNALIPDETSRELKNWWFAKSAKGSPTWDLASQCVVGSGRDARPGVLLVEAKAHEGELESGGKSLKHDATSASRRNHERIGKAIEEANEGLRSLTGDQAWGLSRDSAYQLANRFAWGWKLASLGVPVVLVYLGFLNALEMSDKGDLFCEPHDWMECVKKHAKGKVPEEAWERDWKTPEGTVFVPRIMTVSQSLRAVKMSR